MATITIDIPDEQVTEVIASLRSMGVSINVAKQDVIEDETIYLLKSPKNASRLLQSIEDYENGKAKERTLLKK